MDKVTLDRINEVMTRDDQQYYYNVKVWCQYNLYPSELNNEQKKEFEKSVCNYEFKSEDDKPHLVYWMNGIPLNVVYTSFKRQKLLKNAHVSGRGHHLREKGMLYRLATEFKVHWKSIKTDVKEFVCEKHCEINKKIPDELQLDRNGNWRLLVLEIIGPLAVSKRGSRYVCMIVDPITRWIEAEPMEIFNVVNVGKFVYHQFLKFGLANIYSVGFSINFINDLNVYLKNRAVNFDQEMASYDQSLLDHNPFSKVYFYMDDIQFIKGILNRKNNDLNSIEENIGVAFSNGLFRYISFIHKHVYLYPKYWDINLRKAIYEIRDTESLDFGYSPFVAMYPTYERNKMGQLYCNLRHIDIKSESDDEEEELDYLKLVL